VSSSLSAQMITAYDHHWSKRDLLLGEYSSTLNPDDLDEFQSLVRERFYKGVHTAYAEAILLSLSTKLRTQQQIAEALGLKDRTSISQMLRSGTIHGVRLTAALYQYPDLITPPTRDVAALFGFARSTSYIKALVLDDKRIEGSMSPQDFSYLVGVLASDVWKAAICDRDPDTARRLSAEIVRERTIVTPRPPNKGRRRSEQYVLMLQQIVFDWADFGVLALCAIPDCIPEDNTNKEAAV